MAEKIKILVIAPYKSLQATMEKLANNRTDIELTIFVGDLLEGVKIAKKFNSSSYDIIISRGGTAELLQESVSIPVIEIPLTIYDILRTIKLSENYNSKHAIVGFPSITKSARFLCDLLQYDIGIYTVHNSSEITETLELLRNKGYRMILGDMITTSMAKDFNLDSILITSGTESIEAAFDQAVKTYHDIARLEEKKEFYNSILKNLSCKVVVYDDQKELVYTNQDGLTPDMLSVLKNNIDKVIVEKQRTFFKEFDKQLMHTIATCMSYQSQNYVVYSIKLQNMSFIPSRNGLRYLSKESASNKFYESFYGISNTTSPLRTSIDQFNQTDYPIMVIGEEGTGKEQMVYLVYSQSKLQDNPLVIIDCPKLNDKSWSFLIDNYKSPFNETNITIHIRGIDILPERQYQELFTIINSTNLLSRNHLIFTYSCNENKDMAERCKQIVNEFSCLTLHIPPLRSNLNNIPNLASLYIGYLNLELGKEISGFEPGALDLLKSFSWPHNYNQFKRILNELAVITTALYIKTEDVDKILKREKRQFELENLDTNNLDISRTLEEINIDIVEQVLHEEKGNQSNAAKRLGISRTTLWRMIQKL